ncbi:MAG: ATP-binding protein, partial [Candidatus Natronoplasma sp.]
MVAVRARERLLLHLLGNAKKFRENSEVPLELCQQGISKNIDVSRARVVQLLQSLKDDGMVKEEKKHVKGLKRKRKVYTLNEKGYKKASDLKDRYDEKEVTLKDEKGSEKIQLKNIDEYIDDKNPMIKALNLIEENDVIDLTKEWKEEEPEEIFVGRKEEIKALKRFIKKTKKSGSQMVFVEGEAGIGKTRLVSEVKSFASKEGFDFLSGKSINESAAPYLPFKEAFQQYRNKNKSEERNGSWGGLAFMGRGSEEEEENVDIFESEKEATFHDSAQYLKKIASESPLMIFLDDLHWADKATINLLSYLREKLKDVPVLFVGAYRPEEVGSDHQLKDLIHILKQKRMLEKIELKALKRDSTEEIIKRLLGKKEIPEDFIDLVLDKTEGNPLFVKETLELMKEEKMVDPKNDEFPTKKEDIPIPDLVEQVIERKIGRLGNETGRILQMGSVIGNRVSFQLLTSVTEMEEIALLDHIDALVSNNIWYEDPKEDVFHFSHGLVRDIIYNDLTKPKRRIFHKKVADDLKEIEKGPIEEIYSELAYHYAEAREYEEAVRYTKKAGEQAMDIYAYEDSIDLFQKVVDLVKKGPLELEDEKKTALELLGDLFRLTEEYDKSLERLEEVYQDPAEEQKERLHRKMAYVHLEKGDLEEAMDHVNTGLEEVEETSKEYCRLLELKGWIFAEKEDYERARELYEEEKRIGGMYGYE